MNVQKFSANDLRKSKDSHNFAVLKDSSMLLRRTSVIVRNVLSGIFYACTLYIIGGCLYVRLCSSEYYHLSAAYMATALCLPVNLINAER